MEPRHITDAKRSAEKTAFLSVVVIWFLITVGVVLLTIKDLKHGQSFGLLWISYGCLALMAVQLLRTARRRARAKASEPHGSRSR